MEQKTYTCEMCGNEYEFKRPHEEALAEFAEDFPEHDVEDTVIVCTDCYRRLTGVEE